MNNIMIKIDQINPQKNKVNFSKFTEHLDAIDKEELSLKRNFESFQDKSSYTNHEMNRNIKINSISKPELNEGSFQC